MTVKAVTFDFWNTLYADEGQAYQGLTRRRVDILKRALLEAGVEPDDQELLHVYRQGFAMYLDAWHNERHFGAREHVRFVFESFDTDISNALLARASAAMEDVGLNFHLTLQRGAAQALPRLAQAGVKLGIISDTGLTPGRILLRYLRRDGLLHCFSAATFSDQTGVAKPNARMFRSCLEQLDAEPSEAAHVGDMPRTDIAGAQRLGMKAIRFAGYDDRLEPPAADHVIRDHTALLRILEVEEQSGDPPFPSRLRHQRPQKHASQNRPPGPQPEGSRG